MTSNQTLPRSDALWGPGVGPSPMTADEVVMSEFIAAAIEPRRGRFVVYSYCVSVLVMSFKRSSGIVFVPEGTSPFVAGLRYSLISLLLGWWGLPWGIFWTLQTLIGNTAGGRDVTETVELVRSGLTAGDL